jgi:hypothetical protein
MRELRTRPPRVDDQRSAGLRVPEHQPLVACSPRGSSYLPAEEIVHRAELDQQGCVFESRAAVLYARSVEQRARDEDAEGACGVCGCVA